MKTIPTAEKEFCKLHTAYHGEELNYLSQLTFQGFTGKELFEFCQFVTSSHLEALRSELKDKGSLFPSVDAIINNRLNELK